MEALLELIASMLGPDVETVELLPLVALGLLYLLARRADARRKADHDALVRTVDEHHRETVAVVESLRKSTEHLTETTVQERLMTEVLRRTSSPSP